MITMTSSLAMNIADAIERSPNSFASEHQRKEAIDFAVALWRSGYDCLDTGRLVSVTLETVEG